MGDTPNARPEPETRGAALWPHVDASHVRRGLQFLINIGVPLLVGVLRGESQVALPAVIIGMAFGFADSAGSLFSRLRFLALDALCIGVGAGLGYFARNHAALLVPFFVGLTLGIGLAPLTGRMLPLTGRHAAMAFTVAAALPVTFNLPQAGYLFGVFVLAAAVRTVDYLIAGRCRVSWRSRCSLRPGSAAGCVTRLPSRGPPPRPCGSARRSIPPTPSGSLPPRLWSCRRTPA